MDYPKSNPKVGLHAGKFTDGSADGLAQPSLDPASWANAVTDSILGVQAWTGEAPVESDVTQLARGIVAKVAAMIAAEMAHIDLTGYATIAALGAYAKLAAPQSFSKAQRSTPVQIADSATPAIDLSASNVFYWVLGGARTMPAPTNAAPGQSGCIWLTQDTTGSRTMGYNTFWRWPGGTLPTLSTTAGARDALVYEVNETGTWAVCALIKDIK